MGDNTEIRPDAIVRLLAAGGGIAPTYFNVKEAVRYFFDARAQNYESIAIKYARTESDTRLEIDRLVLYAICKFPTCQTPESICTVALTTDNIAVRQAVKKLIEKHGNNSVAEAWSLLWSAYNEYQSAVVRIRQGARDETAPILEMGEFFRSFKEINKSIESPIWHINPRVWYIGSMMAELSYFHVLDTEIQAVRKAQEDEELRALLLPCDAFELCVTGGHSLIGSWPPLELLGDGESSFVVSTADTIAVGVQINQRLFIGFRGTIFSYLKDWQVNVSFWRKATSDSSARHWIGRYHGGFLTEALRIAELIRNEIKFARLCPREIVLCGHSLGGAVAAISQIILDVDSKPIVRAVIFGSPRYCAGSEFETMKAQDGASLPVHIRHPMDIIPHLPLKILGFSDVPRQFSPDGIEFRSGCGIFGVLSSLRKAAVFAALKAAPHSMQSYRRSLGPIAGIERGNHPEITLKKITPSDLGS